MEDKDYDCYGELHNMDDNLLNRTLMKSVDDKVMSIYRLVKSTYPDIEGFVCVVHEEPLKDGDIDVVANFKLVPKEGSKCKF